MSRGHQRRPKTPKAGQSCHALRIAIPLLSAKSSRRQREYAKRPGVTGNARIELAFEQDPGQQQIRPEQAGCAACDRAVPLLSNGISGTTQSN